MRNRWYSCALEILLIGSVMGIVFCDGLPLQAYICVGVTLELLLALFLFLGVMNLVKAVLRRVWRHRLYIASAFILLVVICFTGWGFIRYMIGFVCDYVPRMARHPFWALSILAVSFMLLAMLFALWRHKIHWWRNQEARKSGYKRRETPVDKLSRDISVNAILEKLQNPESVGTEYVGFFGWWGEGKTFVLEQVKDRIVEIKDTRLEVVDFCPWQCMNRLFLPLALFECIGEALDKRLGGGHIDTFKRFGASVSGVQISEFLGAVPTIGGILRAVWEFFVPTEKLKDRLNNVLKNCKDEFRVVVVIDDVDRLPPDDICDLIRLICANGNLDNVTYLVAADKKYLARALQKMVGIRTDDIRDGNAYLEKVFRKRVYLQKLPAGKLPDEFGDWLREFCGRNKIAYPEGEMRGAIGELIFSFLRTMRDVEVLSNAVENEYVEMMQVLGAQPNIYMADFVALIAMKYYEEGFYNSIFTCRRQYVNLANVYIKDMALKITDAELKNLLAKDADDVAWGRMLKFLTLCVGLRCVTDVGNGVCVYQYDVDQDAATFNFRLQSAFCFESYFTGFTASNIAIGRSHLEGFYSCLADVDKAVEFLAVLARHGSLGMFLRALAYQVQSPLKDHVSSFVRILCRICERVFDGDLMPLVGAVGVDSGRTVFEYIVVCLKQMMEKTEVHPRSIYSKTLLDAFKEENSIKLLAKCIEIEFGQHGERGAHSPIAWFTDDDFDSIQRLYLERFTQLQFAGEMLNAPLNYSLRKVAVKVAKELGGNFVQKVGDSLKTDVDQYPNVIEIARLFSFELIETPRVMILGVKYDELNEFVGAVQMRDALMKYENVLSAQSYAYYKILVAMIERANAGISIDSNVQAAYFNGDNNLRQEIQNRLGDDKHLVMAPHVVWS